MKLRRTLLNRRVATRRTHRLLVPRRTGQNVLRQARLTEVVSATQGRHGIAEGILADCASQVLVHCGGHRTCQKVTATIRQVLLGVKPRL